jgi:ribosomal protein L11 methylase PrmA
MTPAPESTRATGSFRDPSGHVFSRDGRLLRQVNRVYGGEYDHLNASGLYQTLVEQRLLVAHEEVAEPPDWASAKDPAYKVIAPERIPFISYPFEWAFSQLKAAAQTTLRAQRMALDRGMVLKDASAYNVQFRGSDPVLIDTLSFERWAEGTPWIAYRQFCQHFLAPLALMSRTDVRLSGLSRLFIDGPPLDLAARLLPIGSMLSPALLMHLHLHARAQARHGNRPIRVNGATAFSKRAMLGLVESLQGAVEGLTYGLGAGVWADYYGRTNYTPAAMNDKQRIVAAFVQRERPKMLWDLGANTGAFSGLASAHGGYALAFDGDQGAVERHYVERRGRGDRTVLPLVMDLANPTGRMGWNHEERLSLVDRGPADLVLALGLIHHLTLANQVPLPMSAQFFARIARSLVIEFVPRTDSQVEGMLARMPRLDDRYSLEAFEHAFSRHFTTVDAVPVAESERRIYLMRVTEAR